MFQSAPLTKARGDTPGGRSLLIRYRFNPLPSQKQGETDSARDDPPPHREVSIRSPHKSKGRRLDGDGSAAVGAFQSAPLTKARGDLVELTHVIGDEGFQSAPLTKARGDVSDFGALRGTSGFNPLPSQKQGETRVAARTHTAPTVSIRSPHKSKGRQFKIRSPTE